jgi:hypothetical protein
VYPFFVALASCQWLAYSEASAQPNQQGRIDFLESARNPSLRSVDSAGLPADALRTRLHGQDARATKNGHAHSVSSCLQLPRGILRKGRMHLSGMYQGEIGKETAAC